MQGYQHLLLGTVAGISAATIVDEPLSGTVLCMACMVGSLYPDIDIGTSKFGKKFKITSFMLSRIFGHRGFIHTPLNGLLLWCIIVKITSGIVPEMTYYIAYGFTIGFFLHLVQDTFTRGGIMWFYPIAIKIRLLPIKSNSPWCFVITFVLAIVCVMFFLWYIPSSQIITTFAPL